MELTFLIGHDGANIKREHSRRACTPCRQKKKRCFHNRSNTLKRPIQADEFRLRRAGAYTQDGSDTSLRHVSVSESPTHERPNTSSPRGIAEQQPSCQPTSSVLNTDEPKPDSHHFSCDSNPIVTLIDSPETRLQNGHSQRGDVGAWLYDKRTTAPVNKTKYFPTLAGFYPYQSTGEGSLLPSKQSQEVLIDIYFRRIHPVLPLLDEDETRSQFTNGTISLPLLQSICLTSSKDLSAVSLLNVGSDTAVLPLEKFCELIYNDIMKNMLRGEEKKKTVIIQILTLLSLHEWGPDGSEYCSLSLSQAIHHAQTLGLHLLKAHDPSKFSLRALFWCLWSLDKWNAAINGRPVMIHDCDMGQDVADVIPLFEPPFRIWLRLADQLGEVIRFYRPMKNKIFEQDLEIPTFEEIVGSSDAWDTNIEHLNSLELFYHAIVVLFTHSKGLQGRSHSRISKIRQSQSIMMINTLVRNNRMEDLLPIPMSAYTLSLAFSITYIQFKESKLSSSRVLATENLELFYKHLKSLSDTWWLASVMMRLGKRALDFIRRRIVQEEPHGFQTDAAQLNIETCIRFPSLNGVSSAPCTRSQDTASSLQRQGNAEDNIKSPENSLFGSAILSEFSRTLENSTTSSSDEGYFDTFFENFADVNFPSASCDQSFWYPELAV
ncbi:hypothetical protein BGW36DRAFT_351788 [Talaromyces proteolyticus]|uniref:Xylanolytic transcriptional activator regulatory domain-containing protein n=1 Tax=Talaromyces proteolyticus TaxID=1131652 RepID=A0AAD4PRQ6_9EURO|nr:uncharacterized protein BGW36DRAFT_351788 [Talaromyces proteolyticus]KAH8689474.1 hypothetical protein BGW36DRAFT_351788 [Talaromyces proteolyticus]